MNNQSIVGRWLAGGAALCMLFNAAAAELPVGFRVLGRNGEEAAPPPPGWQLVETQQAAAGRREAPDAAGGLRASPLYYEIELFPELPPPPPAAARAEAVMARGEYEPLLLQLYSPRDEEGLSLEIAGLKNASGTEFPREYWEARTVKFLTAPVDMDRKTYRYLAGPNEHLDAATLTGGRSAFIWLTFYADAATEPGEYAGLIRITAASGAVAEVPLTLRVLPFELPRLRRAYGAYMDGSAWLGIRPWLKPDTYGDLFTLWKAYGMEAPALFLQGCPALAYDRDGELQVDLTFFDPIFDRILEAGLAGPVVLNTGSVSADFFAQRAARLKREQPDRYRTPGELYAEFNRRIIEYAEARGMPELVIAPGEESTINPELAGAIAGAGLARTIFIDTGHISSRAVRHSSLSERWGDRCSIRQTNLVNDDRAECARASAQEAWFYNLGWQRIHWGFTMDKFDADGYQNWAGEWPDVDPYNRIAGESLAGQPNCWMATYGAVGGGTLSSQDFEQAREGIDDSRYVAWLRGLIAAGRAAGDAESLALAEDAYGVLEDIFGRIPRDSVSFEVADQSPVQPAPDRAEQFRRMVVAAGMPLYERLGDVAPVFSGRALLPEPQPAGARTVALTPDPDFFLPDAFRPAPGNTAAPGEAGYACVNTVDGALAVWVPSTRTARGDGVRDGAFLMGDDAGDENERPAHWVELDGFWLYRYPVTVGQWKKFLAATGYEWSSSDRPDEWPPYMRDGRSAEWVLSLPDDVPVCRVSRLDAEAYAEWAGVRLPTEAQWEWAGRGPAGLVYPWGNAWRDEAANYRDGRSPRRYFAAGEWPDNVSWCGAVGMAANMREWCGDDFDQDSNFYARSPRLNPVSEGRLQRPILRGSSAFYGGPGRHRLSGKYYTDWFDIRCELNGFRPAVTREGRGR